MRSKNSDMNISDAHLLQNSEKDFQWVFHMNDYYNQEDFVYMYCI